MNILDKLRKYKHAGIINALSTGLLNSVVADSLAILADHRSMITPQFAPMGIPMYGLGKSPLMKPYLSEVEGGEVKLSPFMRPTYYSGPSHDNGGIKDLIYPSDIIFSNRIKLGKKSLADREKERQKRFKKSFSSGGIIGYNTAKRTLKSLEMEREVDLMIQDMMQRRNSSGMPKYKYGKPPWKPPHLIDKFYNDLYATAAYNDPLLRSVSFGYHHPLVPQVDPRNMFGTVSELDELRLSEENYAMDDSPVRKDNQIGLRYPQRPYVGKIMPTSEFLFRINSPLATYGDYIQYAKRLGNTGYIFNDNDRFKLHAYGRRYKKWLKKNGVKPSARKGGHKGTYFRSDGENLSFTMGDKIGLASMAFSAISPLLTTIRNRMGDRPNRNHMIGYLDEARRYNDMQMDLAYSQRDKMQSDITRARSAASINNALNTRSLNTYRAMETLSDKRAQIMNMNAIAKTTPLINSTINQRAQMERAYGRDVAAMQMRVDDMDKRDRDSFYSNMSKSLASIGEGGMALAKLINQRISDKNAMEAISKTLGDYGISMTEDGAKLTYFGKPIDEFDDAQARAQLNSLMKGIIERIKSIYDMTPEYKRKGG